MCDKAPPQAARAQPFCDEPAAHKKRKRNAEAGASCDKERVGFDRPRQSGCALGRVRSSV